MTNLSKAALLISLLVALPARAADNPVTVDRKPPTTRTRTFDPKSPPSEIHLNGHEAALTRSTYLCGASLAYEILSQTPAGPCSSATIRVDSVKVDLSLDTTIFLPTTATKKLTAHEQGHRQIAEVVYQSAELIARQLAAPLVGRTFTATGPDPDSAAKAASQKVVDKLCDDYMSTAPSRSATINSLYDKLTDHGRNTLPEPDAIRQAFDQTPATTRPGQTNH